MTDRAWNAYAESAASRARLEACGGDRDLYLAKECERIDKIFAPLRRPNAQQKDKAA